LRAEGYNTLVPDVSPETVDIWDAADRFGFLVLGHLSDAHAALAESLQHHVCCLGWLLSLKHPLRKAFGCTIGIRGLRLEQGARDKSQQERGEKAGLGSMTGWGCFPFFAEQDKADVQRFVLTKSPSANTGAPPASPTILGWITGLALD